MSKVITFSTVFPDYHPKAGQPTYFVEKIANGLIQLGIDCSPLAPYPIDNFNYRLFENCIPKYHTIRAGNRWKVGDKFSPRIWGDNINTKSGRSGPYHSKQIIVGPDIEIKKVFNFQILNVFQVSVFAKAIAINELVLSHEELIEVANNDGLSYDDFISWFKLNKIVENNITPMFEGQIICWNENINYNF